MSDDLAARVEEALRRAAILRTETVHLWAADVRSIKERLNSLSQTIRERDEAWLPIALCPTDGVWRATRLPDGSAVMASFNGGRWQTKEHGYHMPERPTHVVGGVQRYSAPYDADVVRNLPEGIYPTHFRPNDTVFGRALSKENTDNAR